MNYVLSVLLALGLLSGLTDLRSEELRILSERPPLRRDAVVQGYLKVRLHSSDTSGLVSLGLRRARPLLPHNQSITWRRQQSIDILSNTDSKRLQRILALERDLLRTYIVRYDTDEEPERIAQRLSECGLVDVAEPLTVARTTGIPNDPDVGRQPMLRTIRAYDAWDVEPGDSTVLIGISDSGVFTEHEDLVASVYTNHREIPGNGIDDDNNGYVDDYRGYNFCTEIDSTRPGDPRNYKDTHGTGVAGICAATVDNGIGIAGVTKGNRIVPLKTMPEGSGAILFGYESILYCALNNIHVVNCSWGGFSYSCIDESIVAYAIARGTAVVAAAGNHGTPAAFYPAAYDGVLGVGVTDESDRVVPMTARGPHVDIMAPGQYTWTTNKDGGYGGFCCTSGAAPIVSAAVAMVRSRYKELDALQACAVVRESAVSIDSVNGELAQLLPGRLDLLRAVTAPIDSMASLRLVNDTTIKPFRNDVEDSLPRSAMWSVGDAVIIVAQFVADMASITSLSADVTEAGPQPAAIRTTQQTIQLPSIQSGDTSALFVVPVIIERETDTTAFIQVDVRAITEYGTTYTKRFYVGVTPSTTWLTVRNDVVVIGVGDRMRTGYADISRALGPGVRYRASCGLLYEGGFMVSEGGRVVSAVRGDRTIDNHFRPRTVFGETSVYRAISTDDDAPDSLRIGLTIDRHIIPPERGQAILTDHVAITNTSGRDLTDVVVGWFYDWDIGAAPSANMVDIRTAHDADIPLAVVYSVSDSTAPVVIIRQESFSVGSSAFTYAMSNLITYDGFTSGEKDSALRGLLPSATEPTDIAVVAGASFPGPWRQGERREIVTYIIIDSTRSAALLLAGEQTRVPITTTDPYPVPTSDMVTMSIPQHDEQRYSWRVIDAVGREVSAPGSVLHRGRRADVTIETSTLASGTYTFVVIAESSTGNRHVHTGNFVVVR